MNWILFGVQSGIIITCILYLLFRKKKNLTFLLISCVFLVAQLAITVLGVVRSETVRTSTDMEALSGQLNNLSYVSDSLYILITIILTVMSILFVRKNYNREKENRKNL